jgi:hypothetical protein
VEVVALGHNQYQLVMHLAVLGVIQFLVVVLVNLKLQQQAQMAHLIVVVVVLVLLAM